MTERAFRFHRFDFALRPAPWVLAAALLLGGCDTVKQIPSQIAAFPGDIASRVGDLFSSGDAGAALAAAGDVDLIVLPLSGTDWPGRRALAEDLVRILRASSPNVRTAERADGRSQTLSGQVETIDTTGAVAWIEIRWLHHRGDGRLIAEHRQIAAMDREIWDKSAPAAVRLLASEVAPKAAAVLREGQAPALMARATETGVGGAAEMPIGHEVASNQPTANPASASRLDPSVAPYGSSAQGGAPMLPAREIAAAPVAPVQGSPLSAAWTNPVIVVRSVDGAPGDGNQALILAIKQALRVRDFMVTEDPRQAVFQIDGKVEVAPPANGRQRTKVTWIVTTVSGGQVGRAIQENVIPAGSLNGAWGQVAAMVANAAADGVEELFGRPTTRKAQMAVPPTPPLPLVPGRALPPPSR